jgi:hypothetical protein
MDSARDRATGSIVDAEQLWDMEIVERDGFVCPGCAVDVYPASYLKDINRRRPHFKLPKLSVHSDGCGMAGVERLVVRARTKTVDMTAPRSLPAPFPNRLYVPTVNATTDQDGAAVAIDMVKRRAKSGLQDRRAGRSPLQCTNYLGHTVTTLRPICRVFMEYPHDRFHLPVRIPHCRGRTYGTAFQQLGFADVRALCGRGDPVGLFYAPLSWDFATKGAGYEEWTLSAGAWPKGSKRPTAHYRVRIDWSEWTSLQRATLRHELVRARNEIVGKKGIPEKAWLFFVGRQDREDSALFVVDQYPLISCRVGEMRWPKRTTSASKRG